MVVGITFSAFDVLHAGHYLMLKEAKEQCDYLIVGLHRDPSIAPFEYRGKKKAKPIQTVEERRIQLEGCKYVDEIIEYDTEDELFKILIDRKPDVRIIGKDWEGKKFTGHELPMRVYYNSRSHNYSSSNLRERIKNDTTI